MSGKETNLLHFKNISDISSTLDIYQKDKTMTKILEKFFEDYPACTFSKITDRSIIASLNHNQFIFADDGYAFYEYIENGILRSKEINRKFNWKYLI